MKYYVDLDADEVADELRAVHKARGDILGDTLPPPGGEQQESFRRPNDGSSFNKPR